MPLVRYCLLYKLGGVYIDIDLEPLVPFRDIDYPKGIIYKKYAF